MQLFKYIFAVKQKYSFTVAIGLSGADIFNEFPLQACFCR